MVEDKQSGLIVPEGSRDLTRRVWTEDFMKPLRRLSKQFDQSGEELNIAFYCKKCGKLCEFQQPEFSFHAELVCDCTRRVIE